MCLAPPPFNKTSRKRFSERRWKCRLCQAQAGAAQRLDRRALYVRLSLSSTPFSVRAYVGSNAAGKHRGARAKGPFWGRNHAEPAAALRGRQRLQARPRQPGGMCIRRLRLLPCSTGWTLTLWFSWYVERQVYTDASVDQSLIVEVLVLHTMMHDALCVGDRKLPRQPAEWRGSPAGAHPGARQRLR